MAGPQGEGGLAYIDLRALSESVARTDAHSRLSTCGLPFAPAGSAWAVLCVVVRVTARTESGIGNVTWGL